MTPLDAISKWLNEQDVVEIVLWRFMPIFCDRPQSYRRAGAQETQHLYDQTGCDTGLNDNTQVFEVPPNNYFMMGENRDNSTDSRVPPDQGGVGYVPDRNIIGYVSTHAGEQGEPIEIIDFLVDGPQLYREEDQDKRMSIFVRTCRNNRMCRL
jgi:Signal peptidase, peptidase S26